MNESFGTISEESLRRPVQPRAGFVRILKLVSLLIFRQNNLVVVDTFFSSPAGPEETVLACTTIFVLQETPLTFCYMRPKRRDMKAAYLTVKPNNPRLDSHMASMAKRMKLDSAHLALKSIQIDADVGDEDKKEDDGEDELLTSALPLFYPVQRTHHIIDGYYDLRATDVDYDGECGNEGNTQPFKLVDARFAAAEHHWDAEQEAGRYRLIAPREDRQSASPESKDRGDRMVMALEMVKSRRRRQSPEEWEAVTAKFRSQLQEPSDFSLIQSDTPLWRVRTCMSFTKNIPVDSIT
jgi:hypothetical protein